MGPKTTLRVDVRQLICCLKLMFKIYYSVSKYIEREKERGHMLE